MFNLVQNENMKIYGRVRTWVLISLLLITVLAQAGLTYAFMDKEDNPNWKQDLTQQNEELQKAIDDQDMPLPESIKQSTMSEIQKNEYYIAHDINPNRITGWEFVQDATRQFTLVTIFVVMIAGEIVASEFTWGTIKLLLIRPVSRTRILLSKYLATLLFAVLLCAILFGWSYLLGGLFFGFAGFDEPYIYSDQHGVIHQMNMAGRVWIGFGLEFVSLLMFVTFAFMISAAFRSSSLAISLSLLLMFVGNIMVSLLSRYEWVKYTLFANLDLLQYVEGTPVVEGMTLTFSVVVLMVYLVVFYAVSWILFVKRDVTA